jgi:aminoglycoside N3'-acetyltransferase
VTEDDLVADLRRLGVRKGDVVMVHASMRAIGPVDGAAAGVVAALDAAVGESGTLLMVPGARDDWAWVDDRPETERPALRADAPPFDALTTPSDPDVGVLAEVFRTALGALVSDHPDARFAARGRMAEHLVADPPWHDYYGAGSALERLVEAGGKVLRLGADPDTITLTHYAENVAAVRNKRRVRRYHRVLLDGEPEIRVVDTLDDSSGIVDYPGDYFTEILDAYLATGRASVGSVGNAPSELIDAADYTRFAVDWMNANL